MANRAILTRGALVEDEAEADEVAEDAAEAIFVIMFLAPGAASAYKSLSLL